MNFRILIPSGDWPDLILNCHEEIFPGGLIHKVPDPTRSNIVVLAKWLWNLDLELTYDPDDERRVGAPQEPYLLEDLIKLLNGGVYSVAYPTDYGKSTLIEMSVVFSLIFWPKWTSNTIVKANEDASVAAARVCWWKLLTTANILPYCRPLTGLRQGNPEVKKGFYIEGSELRTSGARDPSLYPAGIGDSSLPGRRGRAHFDDLETENDVKSEAKMDTKRKQLNSCVRLIQRGARFLWMITGTPQGANSLMYAVSKDFKSIGIQFEVIKRPEYFEMGHPKAGQLRWPAARLKSEIQRRLMDPAAYQIAYGLTPPGSDWYDGELAQTTLKDHDFPYVQSAQEFRDYYRGMLYQSISPKIGFDPKFRHQADADRFVESSVAGTRFYIGWDPASTGTYALNLLAFAGSGRFILRSLIDAGTPDEQCYWIKSQRLQFPGLTVVIEADATQLSFASVLMHVDPQCPWTPHQTHGYNKESKIIGIPGMMREIMQGLWHLPWPNNEFGLATFGPLLTEIERWGPVAHPHGIPSLWFVWHFEMAAVVGQSTTEEAGQNRHYQVNIAPANGDPFQLGQRPAVSPESRKAWTRRWSRFRST